MRFVPNILSLIRLILSPSLLLVTTHKILFIIIYLLCGISDVLDGYIARKTNNQTTLGAKLDTLADLIMFSVIIITLDVWAISISNQIIIWIIGIALIRLISILIILIRFHQFAILHTYGNKLTGFIFFAAPIVCIISGSRFIIIALCTAALFSAIEECIINITSKTLDLNRKSILPFQ